MTKPKIDLAGMTAQERLELAEELWNSLETDPAALPLTDGQTAELDRRVAAYRADREPGRPWEEVLADIEAAHRRRSA
jgi:putative addiction module component (TIGR02574 family)